MSINGTAVHKYLITLKSGKEIRLATRACPIKSCLESFAKGEDLALRTLAVQDRDGEFILLLNTNEIAAIEMIEKG